jgi:hypothetical protein
MLNRLAISSRPGIDYMRYLGLNQLEKSAVAEHLTSTAHRTDFDCTSKLGMATRYMDSLMNEAVKIRLHPDSFNRGEGFNLSHT